MKEQRVQYELNFGSPPLVRGGSKELMEISAIVDASNENIVSFGDGQKRKLIGDRNEILTSVVERTRHLFE